MLKVDKIIETLGLMYPDRQGELLYRNIFELIVAVVLSAQTTDAAVNKITPLLFDKFPTYVELANASIAEVEEIIKHIGLYKVKAQNIIKLSKIILERNGDIPADFDFLISLPGVGRKTANVVLSEGFHIPRIAVDTHVFRVSNRLGIANSDNVLNTELQLMEQIEESIWGVAHIRLLLFGRYFCTAKKPNCLHCPFQLECPHFITKNTSQD